MTNATNNTLNNRHETLFLWDVRKSNPNGDPNGNEPRIDRYSKKCDITDVCIKRSIRNFIALKNGVNNILVTKLGEDALETVTLTERISNYLFGTPDRSKKTKEIVEKLVEGKLDKTKDPYKSFIDKPSSNTLKGIISSEKKDRDKLKEILIDKNGSVESVQNQLIKGLRAYMCGVFSDLRMFGSILALEKDLNSLGGPITGPIQIEMATSLHRVVQSNKQITSVMGSKEEKEAGIIGDTHCIEYGLFASSAIANENAAKFTGLTDNDHDLFLKALWRGTRERHTRSKNQVPRLLIDIKYNKPFHFGDLVSPNSIKLKPKVDEKTEKVIEEEGYRSIDDFTLDLTGFFKKIESRRESVASISFASYGIISLEDFNKGLSEDLKKKTKELMDIDFNVVLFCWNKIPGNDNARLIEFLTTKFDIDWVKAAKIEKTDDGKTIRVFNEKSSISLILNDEKNKINMKINDERINEFIAKMEDGELNIYAETQ